MFEQFTTVLLDRAKGSNRIPSTIIYLETKEGKRRFYIRFSPIQNSDPSYICIREMVSTPANVSKTVFHIHLLKERIAVAINFGGSQFKFDSKKDDSKTLSPEHVAIINSLLMRLV